MTETNSQPINNDLKVLASALLTRSLLARKMGLSYNGQRDLYEALGYIRDPEFSDYYARYSRGDIASRIVSAAPAQCWRKKPTVSEGHGQEDETKFDKAWKDLVNERKVYHYLSRGDKISGIGRFGIVLLGFDDGKDDLREECTKASNLLYIRPYHEGSVEIEAWNEDTRNERYSLPEIYKIKATTADHKKTSDKLVHHSRVIHLAEDLEENDVYGTPRLKGVLNRLQDLELVSGGSAEMFWRGAFPGYHFNANPEFDFKEKEMEALGEELLKYMHELQRYIRTQGIDVKSLATQVADPSNHVGILLDLIAGTTGIPKRILIGSERGELSSTQDESNWMSQIEVRREDHVEPMIIRPFVDRLIKFEVLPEPKDGYTVDWPEIIVLSDKDRAEIGYKRSQAIQAYMNAPGAEQVVPIEMFQKKYLGFSDDEIQQAQEMVAGMLEDENEEINEDGGEDS